MNTPPRRAWVEIDTEALRHNIAVLRACVPEGTQALAVVKADAYGHGAVQVARIALECGATFLAVATVDEAIELRKAGISAPILMLSEPSKDSISEVLRYRISTTITTIEYALALGACASDAGVIAPVHLAVDTGMTRIGINHLDAPSFAMSLDRHSNLKLEGVFTHFATADEPSDWGFRTQVKRFEEAISAMKESGIDTGLVHCANSPSIILHPEIAYDMVRMGIAMYGLHPAKSTYGKIDLWPVMSVHARATYVKQPAPNEGVSYGLTYHTNGFETIVTLPLGYADGVHRTLSGKMDVIYRGKRYHQVGRVCMDQLMFSIPNNQAQTLDLSEKEIEVDDEVIIVGAQGNERISFDELADKCGTINYELCCSFGSMRLPRIYK